MKEQKQSAVFKRWLSHIKATPPGMIPVLLNGTVPAWNVAPLPMKEIHAYLSSVAPRSAWPKWALTG
jgi:hypothetical protein